MAAARLPSALAGLALLAVAVALPRAAPAYRHHTSKVRYQEYAQAAFDQARRDGKPVFLLISAVWCAWCKYFDVETLETDDVSSYLNRHFVSVFVDSDLRPDLTRRYARGWPMTVLFDAEGRVRLAFPGALRKADMLEVLARVVEESRRTPAVAEAPARPLPPTPVTAANYRALLAGHARALDELADAGRGGWGTGRKFPYPRLLQYLLERDDLLRDARRRAHLVKTLDAILGRLWDPVDGGFFRYAERADWSEAHTEKLLTVNVGLALAFHQAGRALRQPRYTQASERAVAWILRVLHDPLEGGFHGSQSADPAYYRLAPDRRRAARTPPVNLDKVAAWNAEAILAFLAIGRATGRPEVLDAAQLSLDFALRRFVTDRGAYHVHRIATQRGEGRGQLEANAWVARAFLEAWRIYRRQSWRDQADALLDYAVAALYDRGSGGFVGARDADAPAGTAPDLPADLNGLMAETLLLAAAGAPERRAWREAAAQAAATAGGRLWAPLVDGEDLTPAALADAVPALRAWARLAPKG